MVHRVADAAIRQSVHPLWPGYRNMRTVNDSNAGALIMAYHGGEFRFDVGWWRVVERLEHQARLPQDFVNDRLAAFSDFRS